MAWPLYGKYIGFNRLVFLNISQGFPRPPKINFKKCNKSNGKSMIKLKVG